MTTETQGACIIIAGAEGENPDDCTTHAHEGATMTTQTLTAPIREHDDVGRIATFDCGCSASQWANDTEMRLELCPLHAAAPAMLAALQGLLADHAMAQRRFLGDDAARAAIDEATS